MLIDVQETGPCPYSSCSKEVTFYHQCDHCAAVFTSACYTSYSVSHMRQVAIDLLHQPDLCRNCGGIQACIENGDEAVQLRFGD